MGSVGGSDLVRPGGLVLQDGPAPSVITVSHFESRDKLDRAKVFGALCDDPRDLLRRLQIHLQNHNENQVSPLGQTRPGRPDGVAQHLEPFGAVVGGGSPGVGLALFVQTGEVGEPGEGLQPPRPECAGGCDLPVGHQARLHAHRLRTPWGSNRGKVVKVERRSGGSHR